MSTTALTASPTVTWKVDPAHSSVEFCVEHLGIATVRGHFASSRAASRSATRSSRRRPNGTIKAAAIDTAEPQRDDHLRSADFFDVENYPEITFESTRIEGIDEDEFRVTGNLTMRGVRQRRRRARRLPRR